MNQLTKSLACEWGKDNIHVNTLAPRLVDTSLVDAVFALLFLVEAMKSHNLEPALNWASTNKEQLIQSGSDIELKFHHRQFVEILQHNGRDEALQYARTFFAPYASSDLSFTG
ncbi:unnamed protein product [Fraxinus pennsylvanica]|uniref:CTLH domain-containing protein n=1 Tax=Fraxinus pennsylvanica TaxID=56036 RepID=A0AAD1ZK39_9LAMI|nr:unnamed protein product [Fraxinus pennsylvanica]